MDGGERFAYKYNMDHRYIWDSSTIGTLRQRDAGSSGGALNLP